MVYNVLTFGIDQNTRSPGKAKERVQISFQEGVTLLSGAQWSPDLHFLLFGGLNFKSGMQDIWSHCEP